MRITCPNCGAAYEVAEGMIPDEGRDVQCSACGHVWFETGVEDLAPPPEPPRRRIPPPEPAAVAASASAREAEPAAAPAVEPVVAPVQEPVPAAASAVDAEIGSVQAPALDAAPVVEAVIGSVQETEPAAPPAPAPAPAPASEAQSEPLAPAPAPAPASEVQSEPLAPAPAPAPASKAQSEHLVPAPVPEAVPAPVIPVPAPAAPAPVEEVAAPQTAPDPAPAPVAQRPALSPEVAAILREEAEREKAARAAARAPVIETQGELGLDETETIRPGPDAETQRAEEARRRMARLRGQSAPPTTAPVTADGGAPPARERLPDIEEINSTLRAASDRAPSSVFAAAEEAEAAEGAPGRGFRRGFLLALIVAAIAATIYVAEDRVTRAAPGLAGPVAAYVAAVDEGRLWLDQRVKALVGSDTPPPADG